MTEQLFAPTTNPYALSQAELDRLRTRVSKAEEAVKAATDWSSKTRAESNVKSLMRELASAELARKEEARASQARFDARYKVVNQSEPSYMEPTYYFAEPKEPKPVVNKPASGPATEFAANMLAELKRRDAAA